MGGGNGSIIIEDLALSQEAQKKIKVALMKVLSRKGFWFKVWRKGIVWGHYDGAVEENNERLAAEENFENIR